MTRPNGNYRRGMPVDLRVGQKTGLKYMMARNASATGGGSLHQGHVSKGELGKIQHLAASHPQDMDGWPDYWERMIPMHYATHVVSPCLGLLNGRAEYVSCFGSGTVREDIQRSPATSSPSKPVTSRSRTAT